MADSTPPAARLRLQRDLGRNPYGGAWWPGGRGLSHELLELVSLWPADRPSIVRYYYLTDEWDRSKPVVPTEADVDEPPRTHTLVLSLFDRSTCRLLLIPPEAPAADAERLLDEASDSGSTWIRRDFETTFGEDDPQHRATVSADGSDA